MSQPSGTICAGPTATPVFHLHLLQRCNLHCLHCYSNSGPGMQALIGLTDARAAVQLAAEWGYESLAISGGEPLLYPDLEDVIAYAQGHGMHVSLVTNGLLEARPASRRALRLANSVCLSVDGSSESHDWIRGRDGACRATFQAMSNLCDAGIPFGVACGVHKGNLADVDELASTVSAAGAGFLSFHAMESAGRAREQLSHLVLGDDERTLLFVAVHLISQRLVDRLSVRCDLVHKERLEAMPSVIYASAPSLEPSSPASLLGVLVLEPDGMFVPVCYGIDRRLALGGLEHVLVNRQEAWQHFVDVGLRDLHAVGRALLRRLRVDDSITVLNPSEMLAQVASRQIGARNPLAHGAPLVVAG